MLKAILAALLVASSAASYAGDFSLRVRGGYFDYHHYDSHRHFRTYDRGYPIRGYRFYRSPYLYGSHFHGDRYSKYYGYPKHYAPRYYGPRGYRDWHSRRSHDRHGRRHDHRHRHRHYHR